MPANDVLEVTLVVCRHLDALDIPHVIGGSLASSAHGVARSTNDVDIVAAIEVEHTDAIAERFEDEFYVEADAIRQAIRHRRSFNMVHFESLFKVDVFIPAEDPVSQSQLRRRIAIVLPGAEGVRLPILSPEDVILQKLRWFDLGDRVSDRQWADIIGVLQTQQLVNLDLAFLREMSDEGGLKELFEKALNEAR